QGRMLQAEEIAGEIDRFRAAVAAVQARMDRALAQDSLSAGDRGIVAALRDIAADDSLTGEAEKAIKGGNDAVSATITAASTIAADFSAVDDHYLNARADDVQAVGRQICLVLLGQDDVSLENIPQGAILIADDIGAWDLARAPLKR
ncbi:phosphoenolpyruvate-utilizing N-terminal domain-containing protein, partial [Mesorhizobium sp. M1C.F.Ca.ET.187.01.1.1]